MIAYAADNDLGRVCLYVDPGYTGATDQRPAFQMLLPARVDKRFGDARERALGIVKLADSVVQVARAAREAILAVDEHARHDPSRTSCRWGGSSYTRWRASLVGA